MPKIRMLLADDHIIVRKGLRSLLDADPDIEVVGEAGDGRQAVEKAEQLLPDVVLMDITMPALNGLEATRRIRKLLPQVKVLILTVHATEEYVFQILRAGASGYVVKQAAVTELISAIHAVHSGGSFLSPAICREVIEEYCLQAEAMEAQDDFGRLTDREREVLQLIAEGHSNRKIAELLSVTEKTVEAHRARLMDKLNVHSIAELTKYAIRKGMISLDQ